MLMEGDILMAKIMKNKNIAATEELAVSLETELSPRNGFSN